MDTEVDLAQLILRTAEADEKAFETLFNATASTLMGVCIGVLKSRSEAEEVLQEAFVRIWRSADTFHPGEYKAISWLATIARNAAIDRLRVSRDHARSEIDPDDLQSRDPSPEEASMIASLRRRLMACLGQLPRARADAVAGAYILGKSYAELAAQHDVPLNTMRTWLRRSLAHLRSCLVDED